MPRQPARIADIVAQLMARRGYARPQGAEFDAAAWREAVGEQLANSTRAGALRRGVLEVFCTSSVLVQELSFQKIELVKRLAELLGEGTIRDLKLRVGPLE